MSWSKVGGLQLSVGEDGGGDKIEQKRRVSKM